MSQHRAFGLTFEINWQCPLLPDPSFQKADVNVNLGAIKSSLSEQSQSWYRANEKQLLLTIPSVARFLIEDGRSIIIDPLCDDLDYINLFLLGSAVCGLLHQRGYLVLHANAINIKDKAILIASTTGGGKSTLAGAFIKKGFSLLTDDVSAIQTLEDGTIVVHPSYSQIKLCESALPFLGYDPSKLKPLGYKTDKYYVPIVKNFCTQSLKIEKVLVLEKHIEDAPLIKKIEGKEKLKFLIEHTYRYSFLSQQELVKQHFELATMLLKKVSWFQLLRPHEGFSAFDLVEKIANEKV